MALSAIKGTLGWGTGNGNNSSFHTIIARGGGGGGTGLVFGGTSNIGGSGIIIVKYQYQ